MKAEKRLVSVVINTDENVFAVYKYDEGEQYKVRIRFWAFYEETASNGFVDIRSIPLIQFEDSNTEFCDVADSSGFLGIIGGGAQSIIMHPSEYLPTD